MLFHLKYLPFPTKYILLQLVSLFPLSCEGNYKLTCSSLTAKKSSVAILGTTPYKRRNTLTKDQVEKDRQEKLRNVLEERRIKEITPSPEWHLSQPMTRLSTIRQIPCTIYPPNY